MKECNLNFSSYFLRTQRNTLARALALWHQYECEKFPYTHEKSKPNNTLRETFLVRYFKFVVSVVPATATTIMQDDGDVWVCVLCMRAWSRCYFCAFSAKVACLYIGIFLSFTSVEPDSVDVCVRFNFGYSSNIVKYLLKSELHAALCSQLHADARRAQTTKQITRRQIHEKNKKIRVKHSSSQDRHTHSVE